MSERINERIVAALLGCSDHRASYYRLMELVFPPLEYPRAYRRSANGGPPGAAMALGKALRKMSEALILWRPEPYRGHRFGQRDVQLRCRDCDDCYRHANSDATTPGFFYSKCVRHRELATKP